MLIQQTKLTSQALSMPMTVVEAQQNSESQDKWCSGVMFAFANTTWVQGYLRLSGMDAAYHRSGSMDVSRSGRWNCHFGA